MQKSKDQLVITSTAILSKMADALTKSAGQDIPLTKRAILNIFAAELAGAKHDWGYVKNSDTPVFAKGLDRKTALGLLGLQETAAAPQVAASEAQPPLIDTAPEGFDLFFEREPLARIFYHSDGRVMIRLTDGSDTTDEDTSLDLHLTHEDIVVIFHESGAGTDEFGGIKFTHEIDGPRKAIIETRGRDLVVHMERCGHTLFNRLRLDWLERALVRAYPCSEGPVLSLPMGDDAISAFTMIAESQVDVIDAVDEYELSSVQLDTAVQRAAAHWTAKKLRSPSFMADLHAMGHHIVADRIVDEDWEMLLEQFPRIKPQTDY